MSIEQNLKTYHSYIKTCLRIWDSREQLKRSKIGLLTDTTKILECYKDELEHKNTDYIVHYGNAIFNARIFQYLLKFDGINKEYYECLSYPNNLDIYDLINIALKVNTSRNIDVIEQNFKIFLAYYFKILQRQELSFEKILNTQIIRHFGNIE